MLLVTLLIACTLLAMIGSGISKGLTTSAEAIEGAKKGLENEQAEAVKA